MANQLSFLAHSTRQRIVPIRAFARAMRERDAAFAERVRGFESRFGPVDEDTLAVLAQASYFCWFEVEYERDYIEVCRAIGAGSPTSLYLCRQVSPGRWAGMHAYVIGVRRWLGADRLIPGVIDRGKVERTARWLGVRTPAVEALAELYLCALIADLSRLSLAKLSGADDPDPEAYVDFRPWYAGRGGTPCTTECRRSLIEKWAERARLETNGEPDDVEELISNLLKASQPACQHRFSRYQDVKITSIGALKWRGAVPPDDEAPKRQAAEWFERANLAGWLAGLPPETSLSRTLYDALGTRTERKETIVRDFFCGPPGDVFWDWLELNAQQCGLTAGARFAAIDAGHRPPAAQGR